MEIQEGQNDSSVGDSLIDELADEYVTRKQAGESPAISEYCHRYPQFATQIRELFPMLSMLEHAKHDSDAQQITPVPPPERIGEYMLLREIGRGGMGVIYSARHAEVGRKVALKILPQRVSNDQRALARFRREARAIAGIHHTNVVPLFEFGEHQGHHFLVMQLIDGESVDRIIADLRNGTTDDSLQSVVARITGDHEVRFSKEEGDTSASGRVAISNATTSNKDIPQRYRDVAELGCQIAAALEYAHRRGIIHRDVKPSNILLDRQGVAWLTDFGLAKTDDEELTQTGDFLGTLRYMAPERFHGICDGRSDVFALGLTLYELIVLRPAFEPSDRIELIHAIETQSPKSIRELNSDVPRDLETIISKAIQPEPNMRYATAGDMAEDLQRFLADEPIRARQFSLAERFFRWRRRNAALANSLTSLVLVVLLMVIGAFAASIRENRLRLQAEESAEAATQSQRMLQRTLYFAEMNLAGQASSAPGGADRIRKLIDHWLPSDQVPEMRGWEWYYLESLCDREQWTLPREHGSLKFWEVAWSPQGNEVAMGCDDGRINLWEPGINTSRRTLGRHPAPVSTIQWSPNGKMLASGDLKGLMKVWNLESGEAICSINANQSEIQALRWSPDSLRLAWGQGQAIMICEISKEAEIIQIGLEEKHHPINVIQWSPDGTHLFAGNWWHNGGGIWDLDQQVRIRHVPARFVKWSANGHDVHKWLTSDRTGRIRVFDSVTGQLLHTLLGHTASIRSFDWSPDGSSLVSGGEDRSLRIWDCESGELKDVLPGHRDQVNHAVWGPTGKRIASVSRDGSAKIWEFPGGSIRTLEGPTTRVQHLTWQPRGGLLAGSSRDGSVYVWDSSNRSLFSIMTAYPDQADCVQWDRDGQRLATSDRKGTLRVWDAATLTCLRELPGHPRTALNVDWHPDGRWIASSGADGSVRLWDLTEAAPQGDTRPLAERVPALRWNPQGSLLASGDRVGNIQLWDLKQQEPVAQWKAHDEAIYDLTWSPDGRRLASSGLDDIAKIWDVDQRELIQELQSHFGPIWGIDWNPQGDRLATSSRDGTVRVWDPVSGREILSLQGIRLTGEFWCVRWSRDGCQLAAGSANGTVTIWDATASYQKAESTSLALQGKVPMPNREAE